MILLTVGMQLGFDRLVRAIDTLAPSLPLPVLAQIGQGEYRPTNMEWRTSIPPADFDAVIADTTLIIAHAGIGTVLTACRVGKPVLLFPRRAAFGEHRNDHQLATVRELHGRPGILVVLEEENLAEAIMAGLSAPPARALAESRDRLKYAVAQFISEGAPV